MSNTDFTTTIGLNSRLFKTEMQRVLSDAEAEAGRSTSRMQNRTRIFAQRQAAEIRQKDESSRKKLLGQGGASVAGEFAKSFITIGLITRGFQEAAEAMEYAAQRNSWLTQDMTDASDAANRLRQSIGTGLVLAFESVGTSAASLIDHQRDVYRFYVNSISDLMSLNRGQGAAVDAAMQTNVRQDRQQALILGTRDARREAAVGIAGLNRDDPQAGELARLQLEIEKTTERYAELRDERLRAVDPGAGSEAERSFVNQETDKQLEAELAPLRERRRLLEEERRERQERRGDERRAAEARAEARRAGLRDDRAAQIEAQRRAAIIEAGMRQRDENARLGVDGPDAARRVIAAQAEASSGYSDQIEELEERKRLEQEASQREADADRERRTRAAAGAQADLERLRVQTLRIEGHDASARALEIQIEKRERLRAIAQDELLTEEQKQRLTRETVELLDRRSRATRDGGIRDGIRGTTNASIASAVVGPGGDAARSVIGAESALDLQIARRRRFAEDRSAVAAIADGRAVPIDGPRAAPDLVSPAGPGVRVAPGPAGGSDAGRQAERSVDLLQQILDETREQTRAFEGSGALTT
ncbi:MAG: hypothetical protein AAFR96_09360 [Planctomycetota bacterium]